MVLKTHAKTGYVCWNRYVEELENSFSEVVLKPLIVLWPGIIF